MKYLNLGCGYPRLAGDEWVNVDTLLSQLRDETPEKYNLLAEKNYVEHDILTPLPFESGYFDGILASHVFEHFDCQQSLVIMLECKRVLRTGGVLVVSVPNASYFRRVHHEDTVRNWPRLFDVTDDANTIPTFFEAALWFDQHKAILTEDALWCYFERAGLQVADIGIAPPEIISKLNRRIFSLEMAGQKP